MFFYKFIASFFGIGYIGKGAGTVAAGFVCVLLYISVTYGLHSDVLLLFVTLLIFVIGTYVSGEVEKSWGKDSKRVVIDEVLGMTVSVLFLPINFKSLALGFVLFRFFDIAKPLYIRRLENLEGGWGVMMDDVLAGVYSNILLQVAGYFYYKSL